MKNFTAINFETANYNRVSACAFGYAKVKDGEIIDSGEFFLNPVGEHAPFQSKVHGITKKDTCGQPSFGELYLQLKELFSLPIVGHSLFDKQVLTALSEHFALNLQFQYIKIYSIAQGILSDLKSHNLKSLLEYFKLPAKTNCSPAMDAESCAKVYLQLMNIGCTGTGSQSKEENYEFSGLVRGILADNMVNYKEAYQLLYWLEDHPQFSNKHDYISSKMREVLEDSRLDNIEAAEVKSMLDQYLREQK